jgi:fructose-specific component phosphotransferase system IIB-like protein
MKYTQPLNEVEDASYVDGNPAIGLSGSIIPAGALENPQREIVNAITDAGLTPSASSNSQLAQAITTKITTASSNLQSQINGKQATITGAATTVTASNLTTSRALISNSSGKIAASDTTATELDYVHGVTSNIQTQLNGKQPSITGAATTITSSDLTASRALISNSNGKVTASDTTATEIGYVHGVTSNIQTQLNNKIKKVTEATYSNDGILYVIAE